MVAVTLYLGVLLATLAYAYFKMFYRRQRPGEPPLVPGHFIWGNGAQFQQHAVNFLLSTVKKFGDVFTLRIFNEHWTMILDIHSYERFAREKNFDFDAIQVHVNRNVFGYKLVDARRMISEAGQKVNGKYLFSSLGNFHDNLKRSFKATIESTKQVQEPVVTQNVTSINNLANEKNSLYDTIDNKDISNYQDSINPSVGLNPLLEKAAVDYNDGWEIDNLRQLASKTFFSPVFYTIFGRGVPGQEGNFHPQVFHKNFDKFHKYFNYLYLGFPAKLFPKALEAVGILAQQPKSLDMIEREGCSEYIKFATKFMLQHSQSERDIICHNLVFLHVNYNTFRAVYWCLYKMMEDLSILDALRKEVDEVVAAKSSGTNEDDLVAEFTLEDINKMPVVDSFLKEVLRWTSGVFMIRKCVKDTKFTTDSGQTFNVRAGDKVAIYPPVIHHDPEIYENPSEFRYNRFIDADFYKNGKKIKHPLVGFGSLCPGQKLAIFQIKWFIVNFVNSFKLELEAGEFTKPDTSKYGHEILPPLNDVKCRYKPRESVPELRYVNNYGQNGTKGLGGISSGNML